VPVAYESDVVKAIRGFKAELRAHEGVQVNAMAVKYLDVEKALESNIAALSEQIARLGAQGIEPSWSQLYRLERYQALQLQTMEELARFNGWAVDVIKAEQLDMMTRGIDNAAAALESMKPGLGQFTKMPHDALQGMVGVARDGSPLGDLLAASYPAMRDGITRELTRSVALGRNPRVTAAAIRKETGLGLNRALTIARTEQLRVYREATRESYKAAGVTQYQRIAALDERTCVGCAIADGEIIPIESEFDEHCNGRCDLLPIIPGVENPVAEGYKEWFDKQPAETQQTILGPGRYDALKSGSASWSDLATHVSDPKWGGAYVPTNVGSLKGVQGADVVRAAENVAAKAASEWKDLGSIADCEKFVSQWATANFKGLSLQDANAFARALRDERKFGKMNIRQITPKMYRRNAAAEWDPNVHGLNYSKTKIAQMSEPHLKDAAEVVAELETRAAQWEKWLEAGKEYGGTASAKNLRNAKACFRELAEQKLALAEGRGVIPYNVSEYAANRAEKVRMLWSHELGHMRYYQRGDLQNTIRHYWNFGGRRVFPSDYARKNVEEWWAESFSAWRFGHGDLVDSRLLDIFEREFTGHVTP